MPKTLAVDQVDVAGISVGGSPRWPGGQGIFQVDVGHGLRADQGRSVRVVIQFVPTETGYRLTRHVALEAIYQSLALSLRRLLQRPG